MAITVKKRPFDYCFTGNPVFYQLYSDLAAASTDVHVEVVVRYKYIKDPDSDYRSLPAIPYSPDAGIVNIDIKDIIEGVLENALPAFPGDETTIHEALSQTAVFYVIFREITPQNSNPSYDTSEAEYIRIGIKGGLSTGKYRGNNFFTNYSLGLAPFLTWQLSGRLAAAGERMYLGYFNTITSGSVKVKLTATYTDGSTEFVLKDMPVQKGLVYFIPSGFEQWGLISDKKLWFWTVQVLDYADPNYPVQLSQLFKYVADNRNNYNDVTIHYRNSFSCIDSVRIRGVITRSIDYETTEQEITLAPDYFSGHFIAPQKAIASRRENMTWKGDVGYLQKNEQDRLRDFGLTKEAWWEIDKKWWPVVVTTPNINNFTSTDDKKWSLPVEFKLAWSGEEYYTPDNVDLGDGIFTDNTCQAYISDVVQDIDLSGSEAAILVSFTENDPRNESTQYRWRVITPNIILYVDWTQQDYGTHSFLFHIQKEVVTYLELQAINTLGIIGKKTVVQVDSRANPGTGSGNECILGNNTNTSDQVTIKINGTTIVDNRFLGANNYFTFLAEDAAGATVEIEFGNISPSWVDLWSGSNGYNPTINGHTVTFTGVTIDNGMNIQIT